MSILFIRSFHFVLQINSSINRVVDHLPINLFVQFYFHLIYESRGVRLSLVKYIDMFSYLKFILLTVVSSLISSHVLLSAFPG